MTGAKVTDQRVCEVERNCFIRLARVTLDAKTLGRRILIALSVPAAVVVVVLSWRVPEPEGHGTEPAQRIENISYMQYVPQPALAPNYGTR